MRFAKARRLVFSLILTLGFTGIASAQTQITSGSIQGTVVDPSGAVIPGADVEAKNLETNITRNLATDSQGRFVFLQLPTGRYTVKVSMPGFATLIQENVTLTVGQAISLTLQMKVAPTSETVTVTDTPTVDTLRTEASTTLDQTTVSNTPILGRKFEDLLTLTPGVSIVQGPDGDEINFNGQRGIFNNISLDGGDYINGFFGEQVGGQRAAIDINLDAVKEFQVVATGANAEFGRTAGGVVNVITKSGTNDLHGSIYHFQRLRGLSANTSDGKPLRHFHREQYGGSIGGPIVKEKAFFFATVERVTGNLQRDNLSSQIGPTPCPQSTFRVGNAADEALISGNADCQRRSLLNFMRATRNQEEGLPVRRPIFTTAPLGKLDWNITPSQLLSFSYNFNWSKKVNETFDVPTYGNSANGIEGAPTKIHVLNWNLYSTLSPTMLNEAHVTYSRERRPRLATPSNVPADTAMGFATTFRFGNPFFLQPKIDELFWRMQVRDNYSIIYGRHTIKFGAEYIHSLNDQVFRGFFTGRYIFDSVVGFLRYASPAAPGGFGPGTVGCQNSAGAVVSYVTAPAACPTGLTPGGGPLLLYLQGAGLTGPATDAAGASRIANNEYALFIQDKWQITTNFTFNYGLRWEAQIFPYPTTFPGDTAYGIFLKNPAFPSNGTLPDQKKMFQPRLGFAWDILNNRKSVLRASWGIYNARQNMLSQVGSITTNGVQQQTLFFNTPIISGILAGGGTNVPTWPGLVSPPSTVTPCTAGGVTNPFPCFTGVRVFDRNYANPRIYTTNVAFEQEIVPDLAFYVDFTHSKGVHLTRFLNYNRPDTFSPFLGEVMVTNSRGKSLYRGLTIGMRKRFSHKYQFEWNYVLSKDLDDDSNERDPFTDRSFDLNNLKLDYALSDRDIRHKFNLFSYAELPWGFEGDLRIQGRTAQPITPPPMRTATNRNSMRKNNKFFSLDWRVKRPIKVHEHFTIIPMVEMFNTFNNDNNVNPLTTPGLFNFDGFLRQGVGDPRQVQLAIRFAF
jgi:hypothetical protein